MFLSITYVSRGNSDSEFVYRLTDSDFETEFSYWLTDSDFETTLNKIMTSITAGVVKEYRRRKLNAGKNTALLILHMEEKWGAHDIYKLIFFQDKYCPEHIDNWSEIAAERDRYMNKIIAMK